jgi:archaellum biogenesis ATPase FlaH
MKTEKTVNKEKIEECHVFTAQALLSRNLKAMPFLLDNIFQQKGLAILGGSSDTGKSSLLRQLAICVALGEKTFLGIKLNPVHNRAIYVSTEDNDDSIAFLLNKVKAAYPSLEESESLLYTFTGYKLLERLDVILRSKPADLIVIDTLSNFLPGDMNQSNQVRAYLEKYNALATKHNCLIIFNHHTSKAAEQRPPSKDNLLGSQGIESFARCVLELRRDYAQTDLRHMCIVKGNYIPDALKQKSTVLKFNSNLLFSTTGKSVDFALLTKPDATKKQKELMEKRIKELLAVNSKITVDKVHAILLEEGFNYGHTTVGDKMKEIRPSKTPKK